MQGFWCTPPLVFYYFWLHSLQKPLQYSLRPTLHLSSELVSTLKNFIPGSSLRASHDTANYHYSSFLSAHLSQRTSRDSRSAERQYMNELRACSLLARKRTNDLTYCAYHKMWCSKTCWTEKIGKGACLRVKKVAELDAIDVHFW